MTLNENGEIFFDFCASTGLVIGGTLFPHRKSHKLTWRSPDGTSENYIDHVAINRTWRSSLWDIRVKRSADVGSDHHLVVAEVKINWSGCLWRSLGQHEGNTVHTGSGTKTWERSSSLRWPTGTMPSIMDWMMKRRQCRMLSRSGVRSKKCISTCEEVLGKIRKERKAWMSEDTWKHVEGRRALKAKL